MIENAGWKMVSINNRMNYAVLTFLYWKNRIESCFNLDKVSGHILDLYRYSDQSLRNWQNHKRDVGIFDIVAIRK